MSAPRENEVRSLLSKAWSRRRRKADSPSVNNAMQLDLNPEFEEPHGKGIKLFLIVATLFATLIFAASKMIGVEWE